MKHDQFTGTIIHGSNRGRSLGFPTANLQLTSTEEQPPSGIYAAWAQLDSSPQLPAAVHVGPRPTFADTMPTVEVHLLNFPDEDLYGQLLTIQLVAKLREVQTFKTITALQQAIADDCRKALAILQS